RMSRFSILSRPAGAYIWFFRGSPLLVQVLLLWDGLPRIVPGLLLPSWAVIVIAFSLNEGAYMAEITRAGITYVDPGQMEAAKSEEHTSELQSLAYLVCRLLLEK